MYEKRWVNENYVWTIIKNKKGMTKNLEWTKIYSCEQKSVMNYFYMNRNLVWTVFYLIPAKKVEHKELKKKPCLRRNLYTKTYKEDLNRNYMWTEEVDEHTMHLNNFLKNELQNLYHKNKMVEQNIGVWI